MNWKRPAEFTMKQVNKLFPLCVGGVHAGADPVAAATLQPQPGLSWPHRCKASWDTTHPWWPVQFPSGMYARAKMSSRKSNSYFGACMCLFHTHSHFFRIKKIQSIEFEFSEGRWDFGRILKPYIVFVNWEERRNWQKLVIEIFNMPALKRITHLTYRISHKPLKCTMSINTEQSHIRI